MLPDLPVLDHEQQTEKSYYSREQTIRRVSSEAITPAAAVAKTNRALRTKTNEIWLTSIVPLLQRTTVEAGMIFSRSTKRPRQGSSHHRSGTAMYRSNAATHNIHYTSKL
eukprot:8690854-Pyramimonas_sp.AAC.1